MITPMKKVLLAGRLVDRETVLETLHEAGMLHVEPVHPELVVVSPALVDQITRVAKALEIIKAVKPTADDTAAAGNPAEWVNQVHQITEQLSSYEEEKSEIQREMKRVSPWGRSDRDALHSLRQSGLHVEFLLSPEGSEDSIQAEVRQIIAKQEGVLYLVAVSRRPISAGPKATRIPEPSRDMVELESDLASLLARERRGEEGLRHLALRRAEIQAYWQELEEQKRFSEVELSLMQAGPIFVLRGWVPQDEASHLGDRLARSGLAVGLQVTDPTAEDLPPTKLQNPWWCRPIECLYGVLGITPGYRESDISPLFLPFLTIFTAMLFADAGYGLVGLTALIVAYGTLTRNGVPKQFVHLFMVLFSGSVVYGVLTNAYFGEPLLRLTSFNAFAANGEMFLKKFCFFLGAIHISLGHLWKIRRNPIGLASLSEVGWILFAWGVYTLVTVLVLGDPQPAWMLPMFGIALALILFFTAPSWNIFLAVARGLGATALSATAFFSDIISYIRLWAVGLASGILAASFNELASPLPLVVAAVLLVAAHGLNIGLCLVAVFAHGVRLNLLEFCNHVGVEWSGQEYQPFRKG